MLVKPHFVSSQSSQPENTITPNTVQQEFPNVAQSRGGAVDVRQRAPLVLDVAHQQAAVEFD